MEGYFLGLFWVLRKCHNRRTKSFYPLFPPIFFRLKIITFPFPPFRTCCTASLMGMDAQAHPQKDCLECRVIGTTVCVGGGDMSKGRHPLPTLRKKRESD